MVCMGLCGSVMSDFLLVGACTGTNYRKVVVAQGSLGPGRKVTVGNLSSLASYFNISIYL